MFIYILEHIYVEWSWTFTYKITLLKAFILYLNIYIQNLVAFYYFGNSLK